MKFFISGYKYRDLINYLSLNKLLEIFSPSYCIKGSINGIENLIPCNLYKTIDMKIDELNDNSFYKEYLNEYKRMNYVDNLYDNIYDKYTIYNIKFHSIIKLFIDVFNYIEGSYITYDIMYGFNSVGAENVENKILLNDEKNRKNNIQLDNECKNLFIDKKSLKNINYVYEVSINYINQLKKYELPDNIVDIKINEYKFPFSNIIINSNDEKEDIDTIIKNYFKKYELYILYQLTLLKEYIDLNVSNIIIEYCKF